MLFLPSSHSKVQFQRYSFHCQQQNSPNSTKCDRDALTTATKLPPFPITRNLLFNQNYYHHQQISGHYHTHSDDNISKVRMKLRLKINSHIKYFHFKGLRCESIYFKAEFMVSNNIHGLFASTKMPRNCSNVRAHDQLKRLSGPRSFSYYMYKHI